MKLVFIVDPIAKLDPGHDTTVAIMEAASQGGHQVWISEIHQLAVLGGKAWATLQALEFTGGTPWYSLRAEEFLPLEEMDAVFMRKDPPVNIYYLYATYILELIDPQKTLVVNSPQGLREANEKMYTLRFAGVMPETIVTQNKAIVRKFVEQQGRAVLKPLGGKAGEGILFLKAGDRNFNSLIEISTGQGKEPVMVQAFLEAAKEGDKRIILLDGQPLGAVNRVPTGSEFRGNMAVGGRVEKTEITPREYEICALVGPQLRADGLYFVGIDVIGGYLTEVNVTSPTGVREIDRLNSTCLGREVITWLEKR
jgi:glutathione synthase